MLAAPPPPDPPLAPRGANPQAGVLAPLAVDATLTVTNTNDSGAGSLRAAIAAAAAGDTIVFDSSLAGQVIVLTSDQLDITKNLTIDGTALASRISISGNNARRVFNVSNNASLTLKGVAVINGAASDGAGLNVASGSTLNLSACLLSGNVASNFGGGVYNYGTLRVSGCTVSGNQAAWGGGIENRATLAITDTTFITNTATSGGAGAETYGGTVTVARSAFIDNSAYNGSTVGSGGGFQSDPGTGNVLLTNVTFSGNRARGSTDDGGGAIMSYGGTLYLTERDHAEQFQRHARRRDQHRSGLCHDDLFQEFDPDRQYGWQRRGQRPVRHVQFPGLQPDRQLERCNADRRDLAQYHRSEPRVECPGKQRRQHANLCAAARQPGDRFHPQRDQRLRQHAGRGRAPPTQTGGLSQLCPGVRPGRFRASGERGFQRHAERRPRPDLRGDADLDPGPPRRRRPRTDDGQCAAPSRLLRLLPARCPSPSRSAPRRPAGWIST